MSLLQKLFSGECKGIAAAFIKELEEHPEDFALKYGVLINKGLGVKYNSTLNAITEPVELELPVTEWWPLEQAIQKWKVKQVMAVINRRENVA